ncbi:MAG TPA: hypothetical protein VFW39_11220 [Sphingomicrobium sp.]|nr:hypothetical protein [Sphingomicrobium sp.]
MQTIYKGYVLKTVQYDHRVTAAVHVFDPRYPDKQLYVAPGIDRAKAFVRAYRDGAYWADKAVQEGRDAAA